MSHEIRTPLNAIIGMSGLLLGTPLNGEQQEFARTICSSGDALLGLISGILDYSKIESGQIELEHKPFDLRDCVESAIDVLAAAAAEKGIDLIYWIEYGAPVAITGDVTRLRQILVNLIGNAVKFTSQGEVFVLVGVAAQLGDGRHRLHFAVQDSGIGIPVDRMDRLFKTFSQVDASTTRNYGGTGLGLAISKRLVEVMNGRIWVESSAGIGSTFHFEVEACSAHAAPKTFERGWVPELTDRRALIVDDNAVNRRLLSLQMGTWGLLPQACASAAEALDCLDRDHGFDVAILDMQMPGMDGLQLTAEIRRRRTPAQLPIVMLTSLGVMRPPASLGISACTTKPLKPAHLFSLLVEALHGSPPRLAAVCDGAGLSENLGKLHPLTILLVEDNPVNQRVAVLMLQRLGYRADLAGNGLEALRALEQQRYDLVLMDLQMPEMDGLQATHEIRRRWPVGHRPRIVAMTANVSLADQEQCITAGMDYFVSKPVRLQDLREALARSPALVRQAFPPAETEEKISDVAVVEPAGALTESMPL